MCVCVCVCVYVCVCVCVCDDSFILLFRCGLQNVYNVLQKHFYCVQ